MTTLRKTVKLSGLLTVLLAFFAGLVLIQFNNHVHAKSRSNQTLIVYFSYKRNSDVRRLRVGNTARVAQDIHRRTGGDLYEIKPARPYTGSYQHVVNQAQREQNRHARPAIAGSLPNVKKYKTVFVGGPIWWEQYPMIIYTFMDRVNLNHKTVIPFTTSEGSGLGNTTAALRHKYPQARVRRGFTVTGNTVINHPNSVARRVNRWLQGLGY